MSNNIGVIGKLALRYNKLEHILKDGKPHSVRELFMNSTLRDLFIAENAIDNALRTLARRGKIFKTPYKDKRYPNVRFAYEWKNKDECIDRPNDIPMCGLLMNGKIKMNVLIDQSINQR